MTQFLTDDWHCKAASGHALNLTFVTSSSSWNGKCFLNKLLRWFQFLVKNAINLIYFDFASYLGTLINSAQQSAHFLNFQKYSLYNGRWPFYTLSPNLVLEYKRAIYHYTSCTFENVATFPSKSRNLLIFSFKACLNPYDF